MVYQGSKSQIAKYLKPIIESYLKDGMSYAEPFVGGANMIDKIDCKNGKTGFDINQSLIALHVENQKDGDIPFFLPSKEDYLFLKSQRNNINNINNWFYGYVGIINSFSGIFWGGYGELKKVNRFLSLERHKNLIKQGNNLNYKTINFVHEDYLNLKFKNTLIYLDPPYQKTSQYSKWLIDPKEFQLKCEEWYNEGNVLILSEYVKPNNNWKEIWKKQKQVSLFASDKKFKTERLFLYIGENNEKTI